jgi:hypothetical protein
MADPKQYGIIGDTSMENFLDPDNTGGGVEEEALVEEKKMARFSKTAEFKRLKGYAESRIKFYQTFLPDGRIVGTGAAGTKIPTPEEWTVANLVIAEFTSLLNEYEGAAQALKDSNAS